jgi:hypothetical protein
MSKCVRLARFLAVSLMAFPTTAFAGAWTLDAGKGIAIVTATASQATKAFNGGGSLETTPRYSKAELQALLEYGATDWLTVILAPSLQHVAIGGPFEAQRTGLGYTEFGARMRFARGDSWVVSAQTTLRVPGTFDKFNPAAIGYTDPEVDVRGLLGYNFKAGAWPAFVDVQVAQRFRLGGPPDEFRADLTLGLEPQDRWLILIQSFNVISEGKGSWEYPSYAYHKFQLSAVYPLTPQLSLQLGGYTTYWGRNALQENGAIVGAWYKF